MNPLSCLSLRTVENRSQSYFPKPGRAPVCVGNQIPGMPMLGRVHRLGCVVHDRLANGIKVRRNKQGISWHGRLYQLDRVNSPAPVAAEKEINGTETAVRFKGDVANVATGVASAVGDERTGYAGSANQVSVAGISHLRN